MRCPEAEAPRRQRLGGRKGLGTPYTGLCQQPYAMDGQPLAPRPLWQAPGNQGFQAVLRAAGPSLPRPTPSSAGREPSERTRSQLRAGEPVTVNIQQGSLQHCRPLLAPASARCNRHPERLKRRHRAPPGLPSTTPSSTPARLHAHPSSPSGSHLLVLPARPDGPVRVHKHAVAVAEGHGPHLRPPNEALDLHSAAPQHNVAASVATRTHTQVPDSEHYARQG